MSAGVPWVPLLRVLERILEQTLELLEVDVAPAERGNDAGSGATPALPVSSAAVAAAPAGSTRNLVRSRSSRRASRISSSVTMTTSSTRRSMSRCDVGAANGAASPSATVVIFSIVTGYPATRLRVTTGAPSGSTPTIRTPGFNAFAATAIPAESPTAHTDRDGVDVGAVLQDLQTHGTLARDDVRIAERVNIMQSVGIPVFVHCGEHGFHRRGKPCFRSILFDRRHFGWDGVLRHENDAAHTGNLGRVSETLAMISG